MESNNLKVVKYDSVPIKAMPEQTLNAKILGSKNEQGLSEWLCRLLSIKPTQENVDRLEVLLPMVKDNCWSMTIEGIKKAFRMYVQGKLPIEPRDNYLTAILFSKVIQEYKNQLPAPKPLQIPKQNISESAKEKILVDGVNRCRTEFKALGILGPGNSHIYDYLFEKGLLKPTEKEKKEAWQKAKIIDRKSKNPLEVNRTKKDSFISEAKRILLEEYFRNEIENRIDA